MQNHGFAIVLALVALLVGAIAWLVYRETRLPAPAHEQAAEPSPEKQETKPASPPAAAPPKSVPRQAAVAPAKPAPPPGQRRMPPFPTPEAIPAGLGREELRRNFGEPALRVSQLKGGALEERFVYIDRAGSRTTIALLVDSRVLWAAGADYADVAAVRRLR